MDLLTANDRPGEYPPSWYAATAALLPPFPALAGTEAADVCVVGGGYTGLSAALHLAEAGLDVVLLEAQRVGWGASGRNGGQVGSGQRRDQDWLEARFGKARARALWDMAEEAKALVRALVARHGIACDLRPGVISRRLPGGRGGGLPRRGGEARARLRLRRGRAARPGRDRGDARDARLSRRRARPRGGAPAPAELCARAGAGGGGGGGADLRGEPGAVALAPGEVRTGGGAGAGAVRASSPATAISAGWCRRWRRG